MVAGKKKKKLMDLQGAGPDLSKKVRHTQYPAITY